AGRRRHRGRAVPAAPPHPAHPRLAGDQRSAAPRRARVHPSARERSLPHGRIRDRPRDDSDRLGRGCPGVAPVGGLRRGHAPGDGLGQIDPALALKLVLTPLLIATASLAGRRWGHAISGWLVGIPFTSGPITLFLFLDHGATFAANAALGSMVGVLATAAFAVEFSSVARRGAKVVASFAAGLIAFGLIGWAAQDLAIAPIPLYAICAVVLVVALRLVKDPGPTESVALPRWDLPARMVLATVLVLAITGSATALGPR